MARKIFASARVLLQLKRYAMIVAVMMPRETWTDERLDDLSKKVDDGFARLDGDIREVREEIKSQGDSLRAEIKNQGDSLRGEIKNQGDSLRGEMSDQGDSLRGEMSDQGNSLRGEMNALRAEMNARFDAANRNLIGVAVAIIAAIIGSNVF
jgi:hypothetical protein